jgi:hypothetical protein
MSEMEIDYVEKKFEKCKNDDSVLEIIDLVFQDLKFFRRMSKKNRRDIILASKLKIADKPKNK